MRSETRWVQASNAGRAVLLSCCLPRVAGENPQGLRGGCHALEVDCMLIEGRDESGRWFENVRTARPSMKTIRRTQPIPVRTRVATAAAFYPELHRALW